VIVRFVLWSLGDSDATIEELRDYLRDESVDAFQSEVEGLLFKAWISDEGGERWGAIYVWESREAAEQPLPSRARELIGKDPEIVEVFDLEATVSVADKLRRLGLAFSS
jgi:hypothetical protein